MKRFYLPKAATLIGRTFDGTDDEIQCAIGNCNVGFGTLAAIIRRTANGARCVIGLHTSGGADGISMRFSNVGALQWVTNGTASGSASAGMTDTSGWGLVAVTKATGSAAPRCHRYLFSDKSWAHANAGSAVTDGPSVAGGTVRLGTRAAGDFFTGDILVAGVWGVVLTDAEIERLPYRLEHWRHLGPLGLWALRQTNVNQRLLDEMPGRADQSSIVGTLVQSSVLLPFDLS